MAGDRYFAQVNNLYDFEGVSAGSNAGVGTGALTLSGHTWESSGQKFGSKCLSFAGAGSGYTGTNAMYGTVDTIYCLETWVKFNNFTANNPIVFALGNSSTVRIAVRRSTGGYLTATYGSNTAFITGSTTLNTGQWYHVALTSDGTDIRLFLDGVSQGSIGYSTTYALAFNNSNRLVIGGDYWASGSNQYLNGYLDDIRLTFGYARYTADFTAPTAAHDTSLDSDHDVWFDNVSVLGHFEGTNGDTSFTVNSMTFTRTNTAKISSTDKKYGSTSIWGDGNKDRFVYSSGGTPSTAFELANSSQDFTVEAWVLRESSNGGSGNRYFIDTRSSSSDNGWTIYTDASGNVVFFTANSARATASGLASMDVWAHIAVCRRGGQMRLFYNGTQHTTSTASYTTACNAPGTVKFGVLSDVFNTDWPGYIDEFRITKGVARYATSFSVTKAIPGAFADDGFPLVSYTYADTFLRLQYALTVFGDASADLAAGIKYRLACYGDDSGDSALSQVYALDAPTMADSVPSLQYALFAPTMSDVQPSFDYWLSACDQTGDTFLANRWALDVYVFADQIVRQLWDLQCFRYLNLAVNGKWALTAPIVFNQSADFAWSLYGPTYAARAVDGAWTLDAYAFSDLVARLKWALDVVTAPSDSFFSQRWAQEAQTVWTKVVSSVTYTLTLTGAPDNKTDVTLPMASYSSRLRSGESSYLQVSVPNARAYASYISQRPNGELVVRRGVRYSDGSTTVQELARASLSAVNLDVGSRSSSVSLQGRETTTNDDPKTVALTGSFYRALSGGKRRFRCAIDNTLRPGDTAIIDGESLVVGELQHQVSTRGGHMEIAEA